MLVGKKFLIIIVTEIELMRLKKIIFQYMQIGAKLIIYYTKVRHINLDKCLHLH